MRFKQLLDPNGAWKLLPAAGLIVILWSTLRGIQNWLRVFLMVRRLPGPAGHPIFGNAKEYLSKHKFFEYAGQWREQFRNFHKTSIFFHPVIIVQSPDAVQAILSRKFKHAEKGFIYKGLQPLLGEGLITSKDEKWHSHRKLITPTFHFNILESFLEVFVSRTRDFMVDLQEAAVAANGGFIDVSPHTRRLTLAFICETAMGVPSSGKKNKQAEIVAAMHKLEEIGIYRMVRPWLLSELLFQFTQKGREQEKYKRILHDFTDEVIKERRETLSQLGKISSDETEDFKEKAIFMDLLINSSQDGKVLTVQDIREEVNTFMFAGQNTTQLAINFCLYLLGRHPNIQEKAFEELESIFGDSEREPTMEDIKKMRYLGNCIKDALRLYPSVPVIARRLTEDEEIDGHTLPKGVDVLILPYVLHRDPQQFPNPEQFDPDNFLPEKRKNRHPFAYIPFSAGPRNCIGQKFAIVAEKTVISAILRQYTVKTKEGPLIVVPNTVLVPKSGIRLSFIPRVRRRTDLQQSDLNIKTTPVVEDTYF
uniref:Cytochrome P450 n=1 Tax=Sogatella furcifera TaxID=113103 RepID=A0A8K0YFW2_SOGFU|nr:cytochrome P450 [Sogatella furcifera]